ncbi:uncharacterized protein SETTUDRAFT_33463 [Exserohilum turcica Et28A]|uniref:EthD domain-containing protein n=1 Tax=Exserohilum turcicum (strain 28A) TaxID=671987 RepID=R0IDD7_EXST2|nr:uncharacterized protein SETTUDRAFT_33463 [Exserohilum turcica Et28A]EOA83141.1 hypothetical protein SETTUDRAFT_33463 [Exserohilum turcica Et28A]
MTIKLLYGLRQSDEQSLESFQIYWREIHGPLVASFQTVLKMTKYVQTHRTPGEVDESVRALRRGLITKEPVYNIVDHYWFEGSASDVVERFRSEQGQNAWNTIIQSEQKYIDFGKSTLFFIQPRLIIPPREPRLHASSGSTIYVCNAFPEFLNQEAYDHWYDCHAPITQRLAGAMFFAKYIQDHPREAPFIKEMRAQRRIKLESKYDFCSIMHFETGTTNDAAFQAAVTETRTDEDKGWQVPGCMNVFMGKEYFIIDIHRMSY